MKKLLLLPVLLLSMFASKAQAPKIIYVNASAIGAGNGTSWTDAYVDFQAGVNGAAAGDSVFVAKGNYQPAISGTSFSMKEGVKIYGGFAGTEGSLSERNLPANLIAGDSSVLKGHDKRVIDNTSNNLTAAAVLDGFNISNGKAISGYGGGIYNISSSPTITNCTFLGNSAGNGGGIYNDNASPIITNCTFSGNTSGYYGGGIYSLSSSPIITNCTFVGNTSSNGGGIFSYQSSPILTNCIFVGNTAATGGGGGNGSGAVQTDASPIFTNCTFVSNRAQSGGAIYDELSSTLTNCIFWGNTATTGADILKYGNTTLDYSYTQNNLIAYGTGNITGSTDPFVNSSNPGGADGIYGTPDDGLHLNFAAGYFATGASPIDAGSNAAIPTGISTDIAGADRNQNSTVDMGAYEGISATQALPVTIMNFRGSLQKGIVTLQWESGLEAGFNHFELQSSTDDKTYTTISTVAAKGSNSNYTYSTTQMEPTAYYRLKVINNDGSSKLSAVVALSQKGSNEVLLYPNPAHSYINIKIATAGSINIYDALGRLVKSQALQAGVNSIDVHSLSAGAYYGVVNGVKLNFVKR